MSNIHTLQSTTVQQNPFRAYDNVGNGPSEPEKKKVKFVEKPQKSVVSERFNRQSVPDHVEIKLVEQVDRKVVKYLVDNFDSLDVAFDRNKERDDQKIYMQKYLKQVTKDGLNKVTYKPSKYCARMYSSGSTRSFQQMERELRHTVAKDMYTDIDICNAHPMLLEQYCDMHNIKCNNLKRYINNREECLSEIMEERKCSRSQAKQDYFIAVLYGKKHTDIESEFFNNYMNEIDAIRRQVRINEPDIENRISKAKGDINKEGRILSFLLNEFENRCLMAIYDFMVSNKVTVGALVFDGIMVATKDIKDSDKLLRACESYVSEKTPFRINLEVKEMDMAVPVGPFESESKYDTMKADFETRCFRLYENFMYLEAGGWAKKTHNDMKTLTSDMLIDDESFYDRWIKDPTAKKYTSMGLYPPGRDCPDGCFNTWRDLAVSDYPEVTEITPEMQKLVDEFLDHIKCMADDSDEGFEFVMDWIAHTVQFPGIKTGVYITWYSMKKGIGKGTVGKFMNALIGDPYVMATSNPSRDVFEDFNSQLSDSIFVFVDEARSKDFAPNMNTFMSMVTEETLPIRGMRQAVKKNVPSYLNFMISSNYLISQESGDRRPMVFKCGERYWQDEVHGARMAAAFKNKEFMRIIYDMLMKRNVAGKNLQNSRPKTRFMAQMEQRSAPLEIQFLDEWAFQKKNVPRNGTRKISSSDLHTHYREFISTLREHKAPSNKAFSMALENLKIDGITSKKSGVQIYIINYKILQKWMVDNNFTEPDTE